MDTKVSSPISVPMVHSNIRNGDISATLLFIGGGLLSILLALFALNPIVKLASTAAQWDLSQPLTLPGQWLPDDLHIWGNGSVSRLNTQFFELMVIVAALFALCGLCAFIVYHFRLTTRFIYILILIVPVVIGCCFLFSRGLLSTDVYSYASYGRMLIFHSTNPYFTPPSAFPHDPISNQLYWTGTVTTYGPIFTLTSALLALIAGDSPSGVVFTFRLFALALHLVNMLLVFATLRATGRSAQTVVAGTLLYAWNPLVILESALGAHNDIFVVTFILLSMFLWARAEQNGTMLRPRGYLPAVIAITLSAMVKFSSLPLIAIAVLALFFKVLRSTTSTDEHSTLHWKSALIAAVTASIVCGIIGVGLYAPFWLGHHVSEIVRSFNSLPAMQSSFNSLLSTLTFINGAHPLPHIIGILIRRRIWNLIYITATVAPIVLGIVVFWRNPQSQTRSIALISLACLTAFLALTPWFFDWYTTWIVGLAVVYMPTRHERLGRTLFAFALTFSASAFLTYYSTLIGVQLPHYELWALPMSVGEIGIPLLVSALVFAYSFWQDRNERDQSSEVVSQA